MPTEKKELDPEDMQRLWGLYKSGESMTSIANTFHVSIQQADRLCRLAATTIGADEALARLNGDTDAPTA